MEVDSRKRISLGPLAKYRFYLLEEDADGVITLTPAVVVPRTRRGPVGQRT